MKKKILAFLILTGCLTTCCAYAAKYKVNTSGVVKHNGKVISPSKNQNYYNTYRSQDYINSNKVNSAQVGTIEIVMDYSGSMSNCILETKKAMATIISQIPTTTNIGFRVFGYNNNGTNLPNTSTVKAVKKLVKKNGKYLAIAEKSFLGCTTGYCSATKQVTSIMPANAQAILNGMNSIDIGGSTPLVYGLDRAVNEDFAYLDRSSPKKIVLITDGGENCGGDPCAFAKDLMAKRSDIHIDVVLINGSARGLACVANTTNGRVYTVNNLSQFTSVITQSMTAPVVQNPVSKNQNYEFYND